MSEKIFLVCVYLMLVNIGKAFPSVAISNSVAKETPLKKLTIEVKAQDDPGVLTKLFAGIEMTYLEAHLKVDVLTDQIKQEAPEASAKALFAVFNAKHDVKIIANATEKVGTDVVHIIQNISQGIENFPHNWYMAALVVIQILMFAVLVYGIRKFVNFYKLIERHSRKSKNEIRPEV